MDYFTHIPTVSYQRDTLAEMDRLDNELYEILNNNIPCVIGWSIAGLQYNFLSIMNKLEKLFFLNIDESESYCTITAGRTFTNFENSILNHTIKTGLAIGIAPKSHYREMEGIKYLPAAEKNLKDYPSQFIKVFTKDKFLCVYMNKQPTFKQLYKIKLLQWTLFKDEIKTPEPNVIDFLQGMLNDDLNKANSALTKIMNRPDFIELKYNDVLECFQRGSNGLREQIEISIKDLQNKIKTYEDRLNEFWSKLYEQNQLLAGLDINNKENFKPIIKYLSKHPYIKTFSRANDSEIKFRFEAPIVYFDKYILDKIKKRKENSYEQKILKIFEINEYELITRCEIRFNVKNFRVRLGTIGDDTRGIIGHPHIDRFNCFGNHNKAIQESAKERDYLGAIEQISQAVLNLNFSDSYVVNTMLKKLKVGNENYITWRNKSTGEMLTTAEVIRKMEGVQNEETETLLF